MTNPTAPSRVVAGQRQLGAAKVCEKVKRAKYDAVAAGLGERARFQPVVLETHGAWGLSAELFVQYMAKLASERCTGATVGELRRRFRLLIALALLRGNARIQEAGIRLQLNAGDGERHASDVASAIARESKGHRRAAEAAAAAAAQDEAAAAAAVASEAAAAAATAAAAAAARAAYDARVGVGWLNANVFSGIDNLAPS